MFERLTAFFQSLNAGASDAGNESFSSDDPRLAAAALMYHVIEADGVLRDVEKERFAEVLRRTYSLDNEALKSLVSAARAADSEAVDLYQFTSVLMKRLGPKERLHFIELLWEMVYADGVNHELEDNIVWRVAELLGIDSRDRVLLRQAVQARQSGTGET
jgi:uncharacterized tellurite resistance protein B-like protein